jgi:hypothetical protein
MIMIDCGLPLAEIYLAWLARTDPDFECHCFARRDGATGEVKLHFGDGESFRISQWDRMPDHIVEAALADWIGRQIAVLPEISARPVGNPWD